MPRGSLFHEDLLGAVVGAGDTLNRTVKVQTATTTRDSYGQESYTWADTITGIPCRISPVKDVRVAGTIRREDQTVVTEPYAVLMAYRADITTDQRLVDDAGRIWDIMRTEHEGEAILLVFVERVNP